MASPIGLEPMTYGLWWGSKMAQAAGLEPTSIQLRYTSVENSAGTPAKYNRIITLQKFRYIFELVTIDLLCQNKLEKSTAKRVIFHFKNQLAKSNEPPITFVQDLVLPNITMSVSKGIKRKYSNA